MVDIKNIYLAQTRFVYDIARDVQKHRASKEVCRHADKFAAVESPFNTSGGEAGGDYIRIQYGEAYAYVHLHAWEIWFNNDEMNCIGTTYNEIIRELTAADTITLYETTPFAWCYDHLEGAEGEYIQRLKYTPIGGAK